MLIACEMVVATPAEPGDKQQVEHHVHGGGEQQVIKRAAAVAQRVHDALARVVEHHRQHAGKIIAEIVDGVGQDLGVGVHPAQDVRRQPNAEPREQQPADGAHENVRMDGALHARGVIRPEIARDGDARAERQPLKKADEQEDERT